MGSVWPNVLIESSHSRFYLKYDVLKVAHKVTKILTWLSKIAQLGYTVRHFDLTKVKLHK